MLILMVLWVWVTLTEMVESSLFSTFNIPIPLHGSAVFFLEQAERTKNEANKRMEMARADFFMVSGLLIAKVQGFN